MKKLILLSLMLLPVLATAQSFQTDLQKPIDDIINGPWVVGGGFTHSTQGTGANIAFISVSYNLVPSTNGMGFNAGPILGYDDCWARGQNKLNSLSGGWNVSWTGKPFAITHLSWLTNDTVTVVAYQLIATPRGGNDVGAISGTSVSVDVANVSGFHFQPTLLWNNRNGQPGFNGNFLGGGLFISHSF